MAWQLVEQAMRAYVLFMFQLIRSLEMGGLRFIVQPYGAKAGRLVAQPARFFDDERSARGEAWRLARFRAGVVVASQRLDTASGCGNRPEAIAVHGRVPDGWGGLTRAA